MRKYWCACTGSVIAGLLPCAVALADGFGGFAPVMNHAAGINPVSVALSDLDGNGTLDLAVANSFDETVTVHLGIGDGTFTPPTPIDAGYRPVQVLVRDINRDGALDLIILNEFVAQGVFLSAINIMLAADGEFGPGVQYLMGETSAAFDIGDLNGDGIDDVVTCDTSPDGLSVRLGNENGTFGARQIFGGAFLPTKVLLGDYTGDGHLDALVCGSIGTAAFYLFPGDGQGGFGAAQSQPVPEIVTTLTQGDLNGDGLLDVVTTDESDHIYMSLGLGGGAFASAITFTDLEARAISGVMLSDVDRDHDTDLIITTNHADRVFVCLGNGDATFAKSVSYPTGFGDRPGVAGDLNNDGAPDMVIPSPAQDQVRVLLNETVVIPADLTGNGVVDSADLAALIALWGQTNTSADLNNDGVVDTFDLAALLAAWGF